MIKAVNTASNKPSFKSKWSVYREFPEKMPSFVDIKAKRDVIDLFTKATTETRIANADGDSLAIYGTLKSDYKNIEGKTFTQWVEKLLESSLYTIKKVG